MNGGAAGSPLAPEPVPELVEGGNRRAPHPSFRPPSRNLSLAPSLPDAPADPTSPFVLSLSLSPSEGGNRRMNGGAAGSPFALSLS